MILGGRFKNPRFPRFPFLLAALQDRSIEDAGENSHETIADPRASSVALIRALLSSVLPVILAFLFTRFRQPAVLLVVRPHTDPRHARQPGQWASDGCPKLVAMLVLRVPEDPGDDESGLLAGENAACHRTFDELFIRHKRVTNVVPNLLGEDGPLVASRCLYPVPPALGCSPPIQGVEEDGLVGQPQGVPTRQLLHLGRAQLLETLLAENGFWIRVDHVQTAEIKSRADFGYFTSVVPRGWRCRRRTGRSREARGYRTRVETEALIDLEHGARVQVPFEIFTG